MKKKFLVLLIVISTVCFGASNASSDTIALSLVMDVSGSINTAEYDLQKNGYANALTSVFASDTSLYGNVALNVIEFGYNNSIQIGWTVIDDALTLGAFTSSILALSRAGISTGATAIGDAITTADLSFGTLAGTWDKYIIDVTTDGANNYGSDPLTAAMAAVDSGDTDVVNALGVGTGSAPNFNYGTGSFSLLAADFGSFESTLTDKLEQEFKPVPEPTTMLLFGIGLLGLAGVSRKK